MTSSVATFDEWYVTITYQQFVKSEGLPLYEGSHIENLATLALGDWERRGGRGAYTRLGNQETNCLQIFEIPAKGELKPEHHIYDEVMYVLSGKGATTIWQPGEPKQTVEWEEGALLAIPLNAWHQEFNASADEPCRLVAGSNLPHILNLYHNVDFVFNNPFCFKDRYSFEMPGFLSNRGKHWNPKVYETNFIADIRNLELDLLPEGGYRTSVMRVSMASTSLGIHVKSVVEGTYTNAHRHEAGAHVMVIEGEGYELLFMPGEEKNRRKVVTRPYAIVAPRENDDSGRFSLRACFEREFDAAFAPRGIVHDESRPRYFLADLIFKNFGRRFVRRVKS